MIHSSGHSVSSLPHTEGIILAVGEEIYKALEEKLTRVWIGYTRW